MEKTKDHSGVTRSFYDEYFSGREKGYAINIGDKKVYDLAVNPFEVFDSFTPPQSFLYLDESIYEHFIKMTSNRLDEFS
ncbi:MAG: hypothetical protein ACR65R_09280 [Methylomicrobium sp.]